MCLDSCMHEIDEGYMPKPKTKAKFLIIGQESGQRLTLML